MSDIRAPCIKRFLCIALCLCLCFSFFEPVVHAEPVSADVVSPALIGLGLKSFGIDFEFLQMGTDSFNAFIEDLVDKYSSFTGIASDILFSLPINLRLNPSTRFISFPLELASIFYDFSLWIQDSYTVDVPISSYYYGLPVYEFANAYDYNYVDLYSGVSPPFSLPNGTSFSVNGTVFSVINSSGKELIYSNDSLYRESAFAYFCTFRNKSGLYCSVSPYRPYHVRPANFITSVASDYQIGTASYSFSGVTIPDVYSSVSVALDTPEVFSDDESMLSYIVSSSLSNDLVIDTTFESELDPPVVDPDAGILQQILDFLRSWWSDVTDFFASLFTSISEAVEQIGEWFGDLGDTITGAIAGAEEWFTDLGATITGALSEIWEDLLEWLGSIVEALEGILEAVADLFDFSFLTNLINRFKTALSAISFSSIWGYVRAWVGSLGSALSTFGTVWSSLPYGLVVPMYAAAVIVLIAALLRRFF